MIVEGESWLSKCSTRFCWKRSQSFTGSFQDSPMVLFVYSVRTRFHHACVSGCKCDGAGYDGDRFGMGVGDGRTTASSAEGLRPFLFLNATFSLAED